MCTLYCQMAAYLMIYANRTSLSLFWNSNLSLGKGRGIPPTVTSFHAVELLANRSTRYAGPVGINSTRLCEHPNSRHPDHGSPSASTRSYITVVSVAMLSVTSLNAVERNWLGAAFQPRCHLAKLFRLAGACQILPAVVQAQQ